jgi:hypothetical protein
MFRVSIGFPFTLPEPNILAQPAAKGMSVSIER